jgi:hypothetical protein
MNATPEEAEAHARVSKRGNRLYVGNLSYDCTYRDLSRFMSGGAWMSWDGSRATGGTGNAGRTARATARAQREWGLVKPRARARGLRAGRHGDGWLHRSTGTSVLARLAGHVDDGGVLCRREPEPSQTVEPNPSHPPNHRATRTMLTI